MSSEKNLAEALTHIGDGIHRIADALDALGFNDKAQPSSIPGIGETLILELREIKGLLQEPSE